MSRADAHDVVEGGQLTDLRPHRLVHGGGDVWMDASGRLEPVAPPELEPLVGRGDIEARNQDALDAGRFGGFENVDLLLRRREQA